MVKIVIGTADVRYGTENDEDNSMLLMLLLTVGIAIIVPRFIDTSVFAMCTGKHLLVHP